MRHASYCQEPQSPKECKISIKTIFSQRPGTYDMILDLLTLSIIAVASISCVYSPLHTSGDADGPKHVMTHSAAVVRHNLGIH